MGLDLREVRGAVVAEVVEHQRRVGQLRPHLRSLVVQHPQRVDLRAAAGVLVQVQVGQEFLQPGPVGRAAGGVAQRGQVDPVPAEAEAPERHIGDRDGLGVERGVVDADGLQTDLEELPVAAGLRALGAEHRAGVGELDRQCAAVQAVLDD